LGGVCQIVALKLDSLFRNGVDALSHVEEWLVEAGLGGDDGLRIGRSAVYVSLALDPHSERTRRQGSCCACLGVAYWHMLTAERKDVIASWNGQAATRNSSDWSLTGPERSMRLKLLWVWVKQNWHWRVAGVQGTQIS
jgi:hypothetical protein